MSGFIRAVQVEQSGSGDYASAIPAVTQWGERQLHPGVTFLVGENGSGKSTLLEAMATSWGCNPEGGSRNFTFATRPSESSLVHDMVLVKGVARPSTSFFLRAESFFNVATEIERLDSAEGLGAKVASAYGERALHEQSHGESFFMLFMNRFWKNGLYFLDEPEAALSVQRQLAFVRRMHDLIQEGAQFIIATHSPLLLAYPESLIYHLTDTGAALVSYRDIPQVQTMQAFMAQPEGSMRKLLD